MATIEELEARVQELEAYEGVRRTIYEYLLFHDLPDKVEDLLDLFAQDAVLEISGYGEAIEGTFDGHAAIAGMYRGLEEQAVGRARTGKHITTNMQITLDGEDEAVVIQYLAVGADKTDKGPGGGIYQERLRREPDGRWRFIKKRIIATSEQSIDQALVEGV